jgi:hypothetical protein
MILFDSSSFFTGSMLPLALAEFDDLLPLVVAGTASGWRVRRQPKSLEARSSI